jgi:hypothetical protein
MKQILFVLALLLAFGLHAGTGIAEEKRIIDAVYAPDHPYNPALKYAGTYNQRLLFVRETRQTAWHRRPMMDRLSYVKCQDALDRLAKRTWNGTLNKDGSCGLIGGRRGELPEWATGNWLNYQEQVNGESQ